MSLLMEIQIKADFDPKKLVEEIQAEITKPPVVTPKKSLKAQSQEARKKAFAFGKKK